MTEKIATLLKKNLPGFAGKAHLYHLDPPLEHTDWNDEVSVHEYVVVSGAYAFMYGPETYIFPANEDGEVTDWGELEGSFKGYIDHNEALERAGYTVAEIGLIVE